MISIPRHVNTSFCDDIRHEIGNKQTCVGIYGGTMFVESFPHLMPQLCVLVRVTTPKNKPLSSVEVSISMEGKVLGEFTVPQDQLEMQEKSTVTYFGERSEDDEVDCIAIGAVFQFVPFQVSAPGLIRSVVRADGEILPSQGLRISTPVKAAETVA